MAFKHNWMHGALLAAALSVGLALPACDDSNNNASPSAGKGGSDSAAGSGAKGGSGGKSGSGASGKGGASGASGKGGGGAAAGSGGSGDTDAGADDCKGAMDCYSCAAKANDEFLNHCTEATCNPFDNSKLSKLNKDGTLPAIP